LARSSTILPIHPVPVGVGTGAVESLTGYLQRVATANALPIGALLALIGWQPSPRSGVSAHRHCDLWPGPLTRLATAIGQPTSVLESLTMRPLLHAVRGPTPVPTRVAIERFFWTRQGFTTVVLHRRYCPGCLQETPVYRLRWQLRELQACPRHEVMLLDACPRCHRRLPLLGQGASVGECGACRALLTAAPTVPARRLLLDAQRALDADYDALIVGGALFGLPNRDVSAWEAIRLRLQFLRVTRRLTQWTLTQGTGVHPGSSLWRPRRTRPVSLGSLLRAIRFHTGSVQAFVRVTPPSDWHIPTPPARRRPCVNPWCADYRSTTTTWTSGSLYYCRSCGTAVSLRGVPRYGVPAPRFPEALYEIYQGVPTGRSWDEALTGAGVPVRHHRRLGQRLVDCGLARRRGEAVVLRPVPRVRVHGYPLTPPLALQQGRGRSRTRDARFAGRVVRALARLHGTQPVTLAALARQLSMNYPTLYRQVRRYGPELTQAITSAGRVLGPD
jgi:hypothetical protein